MVVDGNIPHREMLIGIIEGAARDCEFTTPHETKNAIQHAAHSSLLLKPKGSWSSTAFTLRSIVGVTGSLDCATFGRTHWIPLVTRRIWGEVVGGGSSPWMICRCLMAAMCIFIVDTDTVCARWAVYMMSVHSCTGSGATLSWLQNF